VNNRSKLLVFVDIEGPAPLPGFFICAETRGCVNAVDTAPHWKSEMTGTDALVIRFQCPKCGHELEQTIGSLKLSDHMRCRGCGVGINIDTNRLANAGNAERN